jgi:5-methylcytosine-specific restriction protein A
MYPTQADIMIPLLRAIANRGGQIVFSEVGDEIQDELADYFDLSDAERFETRENINIKGKRVWRLNIQWARKKCIAKKWLDGSIRDVWSLTDAGRRVIGQEVTAAPVPLPPSADELFVEGRELLRHHRDLERNRRLVRRKKRQVLANRGNLTCEVCDFDFAVVYGALGQEFAECHHTRPLAELHRERSTRLSELAIVCANCHRMLHRRPLHTVPELRTVVLARRPAPDAEPSAAADRGGMR